MTRQPHLFFGGLATFTHPADSFYTADVASSCPIIVGIQLIKVPLRASLGQTRSTCLKDNTTSSSHMVSASSRAVFDGMLHDQRDDMVTLLS